MRHWKWILIGLILLVSLLPTVWAESKTAVIERTTVSGMTILLQKSSSSITEVALLLKSGSGLDPAGKRGTAEIMNIYVELFLKYSDPKLSEVSVITYPDYTMITFRAGKSEVDDVLEKVKEVLTRRLYDYDSFTDIQGIVSTDLRGMASYLKSYYDFGREFYGAGHPYNNEISPESVKAINGPDTYKWYRQTYQPGNALLSISGGADLTIAKLQKYFDDMQSEPVDRHLMIAPVQLTANKEIECFDPNGKTAALTIGFPAPRYKDPDFPAFRVMAYYLEEYQHYFEEIRVKEGLIYAGFVFYNYLWKPQSPNIAFLAFTDPDAVGKVQERTLAVVRQLVEQGMTSAEISRVTQAIRAANKAQNTAGKGLAEKNALSHYLQSQLVYDEFLLSQLEKVTPEDVKKAAAKYFQHYIRVAYVPTH